MGGRGADLADGADGGAEVQVRLVLRGGLLARAAGAGLGDPRRLFGDPLAAKVGRDRHRLRAIDPTPEPARELVAHLGGRSLNSKGLA